MEHEWETISDDYSERARIFKNKYMEIEEEYGNEIILSVYKLQNDMYGIFVYYNDNISGIIYVTKDDVYKIKEDIKKELESEYKKGNKNSNEFSNYFNNKYNVKEVPVDFFDEDYESEKNDFYVKEICCVSNNNRMIFSFSLILIAFIGLNFFAGEIINFELLIENKKIFYRNLFRKEFEYNLRDIKFYKIFEVGNGKILSLFLDKKMIWIFELDSDFEVVLDYLKHNKIKKVKM